MKVPNEAQHIFKHFAHKNLISVMTTTVLFHALNFLIGLGVQQVELIISLLRRPLYSVSSTYFILRNFISNDTLL